MMLQVGDSAVVTGRLLLAPAIMDSVGTLTQGELVQVVEVDDFVQCALVWGADSGVEQWIALESLTELGVLFDGFLEGTYDNE